MVKVVAKSFGKEDKLEEILVLIKELVAKTVIEEGCIKYEIYQDKKDPRIMIMIEEWESEEALNKHMASEHFKRIVPQMNALREKASEMNICERVF